MTSYHYPEWADEETHEQMVRNRKWLNCQERSDANKIYKLVHDPYESWGFNTHFSRREITNLIREECIETGCKLKNVETGELFEIKHNHKGHLNGLVLAPVEI